MAKITYDQAKLEMVEIEDSIAFFKSANKPVIPMVLKRYEELLKILTGNASATVSDLLNTKIAVAVNAEGNEELLAELVGAIGKEVKITVSIVEGKLVFKASGSSSAGSSAGSTGIVRSTSEFNHYSVKNKKTGDVEEFDSAAAAVKFILNDGVNPMALPAKFGAGNSMKRVICDYLPKYPAFGENFEVVGSHVAKAPKAETTESATESATEQVTTDANKIAADAETTDVELS